MADGGPEKAPSPSTLSYTEATAELDSIIAELDRGEVDVDRLADRFRRATELVEELDRRIKTTREEVEGLAPRLDAVAEGPAQLRLDDDPT
ncbi:MAG: exodeoxyribonuclease VII small subunit [Acidimicrobiales bacterium]